MYTLKKNVHVQLYTTVRFPRDRENPFKTRSPIRTSYVVRMYMMREVNATTMECIYRGKFLAVKIDMLEITVIFNPSTVQRKFRTNNLINDYFFVFKICF